MSSVTENQTPRKAAAYVRMSTEHQQYSTDNQIAAIQDYARHRGFEIVRIYSDEGKSGLKIQGRDSLARMIADVDQKRADFTGILVYDVSRWGRFQDADESAYYEYICKRAGIAVHYCAEQFDNDGSPVSTIVKGVKRAMAGEYSRELSSKVFQGACRLIQLGYKQGGTAGYGLRRMLVDQNGKRKGILKMGEHKSLQTDRVILVPGPEEEVQTVRWMYAAFVTEGRMEEEIAQALNARGILTDLGRAWTRGTVHGVLINEKYVGNNVYYRTSFKLKRKHVENPEEKWIRCERAFEGIVDRHLFDQAKSIVLTRSYRWTNDEMLEKLRGLATKHSRLTAILIDEQENFPSSTVYRSRFGSLVRAYQLIGYVPQANYAFVEINRLLRKMHSGVVQAIVGNLTPGRAFGSWNPRTGLLNVNDELRVSIVLCRHLETKRGGSRWVIPIRETKADITIAARMDSVNAAIRDYYTFPSIDINQERLRIAEANSTYLDAYRFDSLESFCKLAQRSKIMEAA